MPIYWNKYRSGKSVFYFFCDCKFMADSTVRLRTISAMRALLTYVGEAIYYVVTGTKIILR